MGLRNSRELQNSQGFGNLDLVLDRRRTVIDSTSMRNLGLRGPQDLSRRSGSGASVDTNDTGHSVVSDSKKEEGRFNLLNLFKKKKAQTLAANEQARKAEAAAAELEKENTEKDKRIQYLLSQLKNAGIETEDPLTDSTSQRDSTPSDNPREPSVRFSHTPRSQTPGNEKTGAGASGPGAQ